MVRRWLRVIIFEQAAAISSGYNALKSHIEARMTGCFRPLICFKMGTPNEEE